MIGHKFPDKAVQIIINKQQTALIFISIPMVSTINNAYFELIHKSNDDLNILSLPKIIIR